LQNGQVHMHNRHSHDSCGSARRLLSIAAATAAILALSAPAFAQLSRIGANPMLAATTVRGSDTAYDPVHNVYLTVAAYGPLWGVFSNASGAPIAGAFQINNGTAWAAFPRVAYSPAISGGARGSRVTCNVGGGSYITQIPYNGQTDRNAAPRCP